MKTHYKNIAKFLVLILFLSLLFSCVREKKIEYFDLTMVFSEPLDSEENDPLPHIYADLMNYYEDTISNSKIFVPVVKLERRDYDPTLKLDYEFPLSGLNEFRESLGLLSAYNIIADYDDNLRELKTPIILIKPKGKEQFDIDKQEYKNAFKIDLTTFNDSVSNEIFVQIKNRLNAGKANGKIELVFHYAKQDSSEIIEIVPLPDIPEVKPKPITANSLEEYFQKIADESITTNKEKLKKKVIAKYFADENALVIELGDHGTKVGHTSIKDYLDIVSLQHYKIEILEKKMDKNQKIDTLYIDEL